MQKRKQWPTCWTASKRGIPHEWKRASVDRGLAALIQASPDTEVYNGRVYHILFQDDLKYWVTVSRGGSFINRKKVDSSQEK